MSKYQQQFQPQQPEIRDTVSMSQILFKQIIVCENALSNPDTVNPDGAIDALFHICPSGVRQKVVARSREFKETEDITTYEYWANVRIEDSRKTTTVEHVVYKVLYNVMMQELEAAKMTYRYDSITQVLGNAREKEVPIPAQTKEQAKIYLSKIVEDDHKVGEKYLLYDLLQQIMPPLPATPLLAEEPEAEEEEDDQS